MLSVILPRNKAELALSLAGKNYFFYFFNENKVEMNLKESMVNN